MAFTAASVIRGPGELAVMVVEVTKRIFTRPFQFREFIEQAWFITSVTLMPTILISIPFGAVISLQVGNLTGQLGAQSFAGATAVDDLLAAHRLWIEWLDEGRVRKLALVAQRAGDGRMMCDGCTVGEP